MKAKRASNMSRIINAESPEYVEDAKTLFREYETWLGLDLGFQNFEDELDGLPGKYSPPDGRLLLAYADENPAGCVGLKTFEGEICEVKRLFVREAFRGAGVGKMLIEKLITDARKIGYAKLRLDTYPPKMQKAVKLYESLGFRQIPPYYSNPYEGVIFMELELRAVQSDTEIAASSEWVEKN